MWTTGGGYDDDDDDDDGDGSLKEPGNPRAARICTIIMQRRREKRTIGGGVGRYIVEGEKQIGSRGQRKSIMCDAAVCAFQWVSCKPVRDEFPRLFVRNESLTIRPACPNAR